MRSLNQQRASGFGLSVSSSWALVGAATLAILCAANVRADVYDNAQNCDYSDVSGTLNSCVAVYLHKAEGCQNCNLDGVELRKEDFSGYDLSGTTFKGADLYKTKFDDANLEGADFSGASMYAIDAIDANLQNAVFDDVPSLKYADMPGADLTGALFRDVDTMKKIDFRGAILDATEFDGCSMTLAEVEDTTLNDTTFSNCDIAEGEFAGATLNGVVFQDSRLVDADFSGAELNDVSFEQSDLTNADFTSADVVGGSVDGATLDDIGVENAVFDDICFGPADSLGFDTDVAVTVWNESHDEVPDVFLTCTEPACPAGCTDAFGCTVDTCDAEQGCLNVVDEALCPPGQDTDDDGIDDVEDPDADGDNILDVNEENVDVDGDGLPNFLDKDSDDDGLDDDEDAMLNAFGDAVEIPVPYDCKRFWIGDFNGDGADDVAAAAYYTSGANKVLLNEDGNGTSWTKKNIFSKSAAFRQVGVPGDFDGDGDLDIAVLFGATLSTTNWMYVYLNSSGDGTDWTSSYVGQTSTNYVGDNAIADDYFGLGRDSLVYSSNGTTWRGWDYSVANDSWYNSSAMQTVVSDSNVTWSTAGDLDGDNLKDFIAVYADEIVWTRNLGGKFDDESLIYTADGSDLLGVGVFDVDSDGDLDVVVPRIEGPVSIFENEFGDASSWSEYEIDFVADWSQSGGVRIADMDGNGVDDVIAATNDHVVVLYSDGAWGFTAETVGDDVLRFQLGDMDGDGDQDIVTIPEDYDAMHWYENRR